MLEEPKRASLLLRSVAKTIDLIIVAAAAEMIPRAGFFAGLAYLLISDGLFNGKSLGKQLTGLKVVSIATGKACSVRESILRNLVLCIGTALWRIPLIGWVITLLAVGFEFVMLLGSKEGMRLGDEIAKTTVIEDIKSYNTEGEKKCS
ncbi:MAG: RDD family protein [Thermodesulfovibrionales bacterium]|nr:RDD family protein [Thermodesulfovibrionales bacterium]